MCARLGYELPASATPSTIVVIQDGRALERSDAVLAIARRMRFPWSVLGVFRVLPRGLRDVLYRFMARNRYRWFGRADACMVPTPELRPSIEGIARRTPAELLALLEAAESGLAASADRARARGLGTEFDVTLAGKTHRFMLGTALVHVTTHGMHHRAQCLNMLRHLSAPGISDRLPEIDPLDWQLQAEA